jgi:hypothetical protein
MPITLCCLLWATPGNSSAPHVHEDAVLELLHDHDAMLVQRAVSDDHETPDEVQLYEFRSQAALDGYLTGPRRLVREDERDRVVARTALFPVTFRPGTVISELT